MVHMDLSRPAEWRETDRTSSLGPGACRELVTFVNATTGAFAAFFCVHLYMSGSFASLFCLHVLLWSCQSSELTHALRSFLIGQQVRDVIRTFSVPIV